jgi:hypothetical protein
VLTAGLEGCSGLIRGAAVVGRDVQHVGTKPSLRFCPLASSRWAMPCARSRFPFSITGRGPATSVTDPCWRLPCRFRRRTSYRFRGRSWMRPPRGRYRPRSRAQRAGRRRGRLYIGGGTHPDLPESPARPCPHTSGAVCPVPSRSPTIHCLKLFWLDVGTGGRGRCGGARRSRGCAVSGCPCRGVRACVGCMTGQCAAGWRVVWRRAWVSVVAGVCHDRSGRVPGFPRRNAS